MKEYSDISNRSLTPPCSKIVTKQLKKERSKKSYNTNNEKIDSNDKNNCKWTYPYSIDPDHHQKLTLTKRNEYEYGYSPMQ
jgi:hypothetical protein